MARMEATRTQNGPADQTIACADCGSDFVWTAEEQRFYREKGLRHAPRRCKSCRVQNRQRHERQR